MLYIDGVSVGYDAGSSGRAPRGGLRTPQFSDETSGRTDDVVYMLRIISELTGRTIDRALIMLSRYSTE